MNYRDRLRANLSWYKQHFTETRLTPAEGPSLRFAYRRGGASRAAVLIVNGRTEYIEKYIEVLRELHDGEISFAVYDHCGQGDSGRLLSDPEKGHIDRFDRYVNDLQVAVERCRDLFGSIPIHLLCHSMGGTISWLYYAEHPGAVQSLILTAPMFSIETGVTVPLFIVESIARICCRNGMGERYVTTTGPYDPGLVFADNVLTTDPDRFAFNLFMSNSLPHAQIGGPTYGWLCEAFAAMRKTKRVTRRIDLPVYCLAGRDDRVVGIDSIVRMAAGVNGVYREYAHARHELLMEASETRNRVLDMVREVVLEREAGG